MDKKNLTLGILFMVAAFATLIVGARLQPPPAPAAAPAPASAATQPASPGDPAQTPALVATPSAPKAAFAALSENRADAETTVLANDFVSVRLTDFGGAIENVAFKKYPAVQGMPDSFVFNDRHAAPMLALAELTGLGPETRFQRVSATSREVVYRAVFENRLEVTRRYTLADPADPSADPYRIRHETTLRNLSEHTVTLPRLVLELGTASLVGANDTGIYLNVAAYDGSNNPEVTDRHAFDPGFLSRFGIGDPTPKNVIDHRQSVVWAAVKNQFFASIYTPDKPGESVSVRRVELPPLSGSTRPTTGITAAGRFPVEAIAPGASVVHTGRLYVGPKEYTRLSRSA
ncbi:MAG: hypothetical protein RLZZ50_338, partial [Verrucomicrobiota bacterium]